MPEHVTDLADPHRCQATLTHGQCRRIAEPGHDYCRLHGSTRLKEAEARRQYLLTRIQDQQRLAQFAESEHIKSLRDEIALARILVERRFNAIRTETDMMAACAPLNQLLLTVERLVRTCHQMETSLGTLLARETVIGLAQQLAFAIVEELQGIPHYESVVDRLIERIFEVVNEQPQHPEPHSKQKLLAERE